MKVPGSVPNKVILEDEKNKDRFDTINQYIYMVGKQTPALMKWGIEQ
jgi:small subunit ribosomal protein S4e